jgi:hypothetical protein
MQEWKYVEYKNLRRTKSVPSRKYKYLLDYKLERDGNNRSTVVV